MSVNLATTNRQGPTPNSERIVLLDALRGFALLGVLLVHVNQMAANVTAPGAENVYLMNVALDRWADRFVRIFVEGKAQTLFTVMFGISFIIQFRRLEQSFANPSSVYCRRLFGLLVIGLLHEFLLPTPDILVHFALGGFVLLFVRQWETRSLAEVGLLLALAVMPTALLTGAIGSTAPQFDTVANTNLPALYQYGSYLEIMERNWPTVWFMDHLVRGLLTFQLYVIGRFMLGIVVIRSGLLSDPSHHRRTFDWIAVIGLLIGILLTECIWAERLAGRMGWIDYLAVWHALGLFLPQAGILVLAASYAALFMLGWQTVLGHRFLLRAFAPSGQMAVTNYLLQMLLISLIFYGFGLGLMGRLGSTWCLVLALVVFSMQGLLSYVWLRRFQFGPVEWLWRYWTYKQRPVWRRVQSKT